LEILKVFGKYFLKSFFILIIMFIISSTLFTVAEGIIFYVIYR